MLERVFDQGAERLLRADGTRYTKGIDREMRGVGVDLQHIGATRHHPVTAIARCPHERVGHVSAELQPGFEVVLAGRVRGIDIEVDHSFGRHVRRECKVAAA